jgi:hypothetical protein
MTDRRCVPFKPSRFGLTGMLPVYGGGLNCL